MPLLFCGFSVNFELVQKFDDLGSSAAAFILSLYVSFELAAISATAVVVKLMVTVATFSLFCSLSNYRLHGVIIIHRHFLMVQIHFQLPV